MSGELHAGQNRLCDAMSLIIPLVLTLHFLQVKIIGLIFGGSGSSKENFSIVFLSQRACGRFRGNPSINSGLFSPSAKITKNPPSSHNTDCVIRAGF